MRRGKKSSAGEIIFVTGTDTGVGKTILTALLVYHLRHEGVHALAMKPFACGSHADTDMLRAMQESELSREEITPFYFSQPVAPLAAMMNSAQTISLRHVVKRINELSRRCEILVVEGCGGLLVPLGKNFTIAELIRSLNCAVLVVARNKLGTINHTLLTTRVLDKNGECDFKIVLMNQATPDLSAKTNRKILQQMIGVSVMELQFLGLEINSFRALEKTYKKVKKTLAAILG